MKSTFTIGSRQALAALIAVALAIAVLTSLVTASVIRADGDAIEPGGAVVADHVVGGIDNTLGIQSASYQNAVAAAQTDKPKVVVVATGGTIAGKASGRDTLTSYRAGTYLMEDLLDYLRPELDAVADVTSVQFGNAGSSGYSIAQFRELTMVVEEQLETADAVVVTSGTDTQEEFAYWLDMTVQSKKPVITTGSMRPWAAGDTPAEDMVFGADGPANLYNAIRLAASQQTFCFGTVLMLNDEIMSARDVTKGNSYRMDTFEDRQYGVLGWIDGSRITLGRAPGRVLDCDGQSWFTPFDVSEVEASDLPRTEMVTSYQGAGGEAITAFAQAGVKGIVTAGTGAGGISSAMGQARRSAIASGVWFVNTTRAGTGSSYSSGNGIIPGGDLTAIKARLLLLLSRAFTDDIEVARGWFEQYGQPSFDRSGQVGVVDPTPADPSIVQLTPAVVSQCVDGTSEVFLTVKNTDDDPIDVRVTTPLGGTRFDDIAPGETVQHTFDGRTGRLRAGEAALTASKSVDGRSYTTEQTLSYTAATCG